MGSSQGTMRYVGSCRRTALCRMWVSSEQGLAAAHQLGKAQGSEQQDKVRRQGLQGRRG